MLGKKLLHSQKSYQLIKKKMKKKLQSNPNIIIDYLSIADLDSFEELGDDIHNVNNRIVISGAIYLNKIRLIDNIVITVNE